jgi:hypothetical protein
MPSERILFTQEASRPGPRCGDPHSKHSVSKGTITARARLRSRACKAMCRIATEGASLSLGIFTNESIRPCVQG